MSGFSRFLRIAMAGIALIILGAGLGIWLMLVVGPEQVAESVTEAPAWVVIVGIIGVTFGGAVLAALLAREKPVQVDADPPEFSRHPSQPPPRALMAPAASPSLAPAAVRPDPGAGARGSPVAAPTGWEPTHADLAGGAPTARAEPTFADSTRATPPAAEPFAASHWPPVVPPPPAASPPRRSAQPAWPFRPAPRPGRGPHSDPSALLETGRAVPQDPISDPAWAAPPQPPPGRAPSPPPRRTPSPPPGHTPAPAGTPSPNGAGPPTQRDVGPPFRPEHARPRRIPRVRPATRRPAGPGVLRRAAAALVRAGAATLRGLGRLVWFCGRLAAAAARGLGTAVLAGARGVASAAGWARPRLVAAARWVAARSRAAASAVARGAVALGWVALAGLRASGRGVAHGAVVLSRTVLTGLRATGRGIVRGTGALARATGRAARALPARKPRTSQTVPPRSSTLAQDTLRATPATDRAPAVSPAAAAETPEQRALVAERASEQRELMAGRASEQRVHPAVGTAADDAGPAPGPVTARAGAPVSGVRRGVAGACRTMVSACRSVGREIASACRAVGRGVASACRTLIRAPVAAFALVHRALPARARPARARRPRRKRAGRDPEPDWGQFVAQLHEEAGGDLEELEDAVRHLTAIRRQVATEVRATVLEARLALVSLTPLPVAVGVLGALVNPGVSKELSAGVLAWLALTPAALLTVVGALWLRRVARPPFAALPGRWRAYEERSAQAQQVADAVDRAWLRAVAGQHLEAALEAAVPGDDHPASGLVAFLRSLDHDSPERMEKVLEREQLPGWVAVLARGCTEEADAADVLAAASEQLHAERLLEAQRLARRLPLSTAVPFAACILPATALVVLVTWL